MTRVQRWLAMLEGPSPGDPDAQGFADHCRAVTGRSVTLGALALAVVVVVAWPLDLLLDAPTARALAVFRGSTVALSLAIAVGIRFAPLLRARPSVACLGLPLVAIGGCIANGSRAGLELPWIDHTYLLPLATLVILESTPRRAALTGGLVGGFVAAYFALRPEQLHSVQMWSFVMTMAIATLVSITLGHIVMLLSWRQYVLARALDRDNEQLEVRVAWQTRELGALNERATRLHAAERARIDQELGGRAERLIEGIRTELQGLGPSAAAIPAVETMRRLTEELHSGMRGILSDLGPEGLEDGDLAPALDRLVSTMQTPVGDTRLVSEIDERLTGLDPDVATSVYRIAQEALTNAIRHSRATQITVRASRRDRGMHFELCDDGIGMDQPSSTSGTGVGLVSMRARAERLGAELRVGPRPEGGSRVTLDVARFDRRSPPGSRSEPARRSSPRGASP